MKSSPATAILVGAGLAIAAWGAWLSGPWSHRTASAQSSAPIRIDYPLDGSIFPPEITAPTFLWHDSTAASRWTVEVSCAGSSEKIRLDVSGDLLKRGRLDPQAGPGIELTAEQAATRTWQPDAPTWDRIKRLSMKTPARITISGLDESGSPVSTATVSLSTSADPVGAPVFYRDVPLLLPPPDEKGPIAPLPRAALPLIKWQVRNLAEPHSHVVMEKLPTCANCHSFSRDGKTFGLDLDGPRNDKGLYALVSVSRTMTIRNKDVIRWSSFELNSEARNLEPAVKRFGFMSQVSPDGRYVVTSIGPPNNTNTHASEVPGFANGILDRLYSTNYRSVQFSQVFYPTRGILAWYDRQSGTMKPLPGADDPRFVHTSAFWSPDGKYLVYSRAAARDPYPAGASKPTYANDPNETQIQYDLYKIPFNDGRGGKAMPVAGASANGMSNDFPKVSPDGKWIVWVQNKNGLLMRPDSRLFMVPAEGGTPRLMNCNTALMNSWHTFSPNGRWLAFSSKARSPYTQLMLTHIDAKGNDSPAILIEDTTAANRAVNIPEFVNIPVDGLDKIDPQATEFYRLFDQAFKFLDSNQIPDAINALRAAIERDPEDALSHYVLATALSGNDQEREALAEYRRACDLSPKNAMFRDHLAVSLDLTGDAQGATGELQKAIQLEPDSPEFRFNLGVILESRGDYTGALAPLQKSADLSRGRNWRPFAEMAKVYVKLARNTEAAASARQALDAAQKAGDDKSAQNLRSLVEQYEKDAAGSAHP